MNLQSSRHSHQKRSKRALVQKLILFFAGTIAVCVGLSLLVNQLDKNDEAVFGDVSERFTKGNITYQGVEYTPKNMMSAFLLMGIDQREDVAQYNGPYRSGGQCDFLMLAVIDHQAKTVNRIQIDRDTMAEITVLGVLGNELGTNTLQICLAHGFGDGREQSCQFTVDAVTRLLYGVEIDGYYSMNMDGIPALNELLGGVTVTVEDDFSASDPAMTPGAVVTLHGSQAELFVRSRISVGDGTNASRMKRQRQFLTNAASLAMDRAKADNRFFTQLMDGLKPYALTDIARGRMLNEGNRAANYAMEDIIFPEGEHVIGDDGFMEFRADQEALLRLVLSLFYQRI